MDVITLEVVEYKHRNLKISTKGGSAELPIAGSFRLEDDGIWHWRVCSGYDHKGYFSILSLYLYKIDDIIYRIEKKIIENGYSVRLILNPI